MIALALALAAQQPVRPPVVRRAPTDAQFCRAMTEMTRATMADLPRMVDTVTRIDGVSVFCSLRAVLWNRYIIGDMSQMADGWQAAKQEQWNRLICDDRAFGAMARRGWRFANNMTFRSGERITQDARC